MWSLSAMGLVLRRTAIRFARRAGPQRLSIIRALTLALTIASIAPFAGNLIPVVHAVGTTPVSARCRTSSTGSASPAPRSCSAPIFSSSPGSSSLSASAAYPDHS